MLGVVDPVELDLVLGGNFELHDKNVGHADRSFSGSGDLAEDAVLAVCRVRPDLWYPLAEIVALLAGRAIVALGRVNLTNRQLARHFRDRRMFEPVDCARTDPVALHDRRYVVRIIDAVEARFE